MPDIFGIINETQVPRGRGLVRIGRFADRRNRGRGTVRHVGKTSQRAYGASTSGSVRRIGRQSNRSK